MDETVTTMAPVVEETRNAAAVNTIALVVPRVEAAESVAPTVSAEVKSLASTEIAATVLQQVRHPRVETVRGRPARHDDQIGIRLVMPENLLGTVTTATGDTAPMARELILHELMAHQEGMMFRQRWAAETVMLDVGTGRLAEAAELMSSVAAAVDMGHPEGQAGRRGIQE